MASLLDRGGRGTEFVLIVVPIFIDFSWVGIYFSERQNDVFLFNGPCDPDNPVANTSSPTPFFVTHRTDSLWLVQCLFAILATFYTMPLKVVKIDPRRSLLVTLLLASVDLLVLTPFLLSMVFLPAKFAYVPSFLRTWSAIDGVNAHFFRQNVFDRLVRLTGYMVSVALTMIAVFEYSENNWPVVPVFGGTYDYSYACCTFLEALYWFVVTFSTVGYGDVVPINNVARTVVIICVTAFLLLLPVFVNYVFDILTLFNDFKHISHRVDGAFVVVDGHVRSRTALQALLSIQPREHFDLYQHMVFMSPHEVSDGLKDVQRFTDSFCRSVLLQGTIASTGDADRACVQRSSALFILPNLTQDTDVDGGDEEPTADDADAAEIISHSVVRRDMDVVREQCLRRDWDVIGRTWAARSVGAVQTRRVVLFHHANVDLVQKPRELDCSRCKDVFVLGLDRMEQLVAACSVLLPAFNALLTNMLISGLHYARSRSAMAYYDDDLARQYARDLLEMELFLFVLPADARTLNMAKLSIFAANNLNTCVLARYPHEAVCPAKHMHVESFDFSKAGVLRAGDAVVCLGRDIDVFSAVAFDDVEEPVDPRPAVVQPPTTEQSERLLALPAGKRLGRAPSMSRFFHSLQQHDGDSNSASMQQPAPAPPPLPVPPLNAEELSNAHIVLEEKASRQSARLDDVRKERRVLSLLDSLLGDSSARALRGHVIVAADGIAHGNLVSFVRHLRRAGLVESPRTILILRPTPPGPSEWSEISLFPDVFWQLGRSFVAHDLARAGLADAHSLVVLCDAHDAYAGEGHDSATMDRDKLLTVRTATSLRRSLQTNVRVIVDMACEANLAIAGGGHGLSQRDVGKPSLSAQAETRRQEIKASNRLVGEVHSLWKPALCAAVIEGSLWAPSAMLLELWALHSKGRWVEAFVEALVLQVGIVGGLVVAAPEETDATFGDARARLGEKGAVALGVWRGYDDKPVLDAEDPVPFRGILLTPWGGLQLRPEDRLVVLG